eukprot:751662-Hanusia_phi.AAC.2
MREIRGRSGIWAEITIFRALPVLMHRISNCIGITILSDSALWTGAGLLNRMFGILSRLTFLAYGEAKDTVGLNPNKVSFQTAHLCPKFSKVFGGARQFCEEELGKDSPSLDKCESQLVKDAKGICGGLTDRFPLNVFASSILTSSHRYGTCVVPKAGVQDGSVPA